MGYISINWVKKFFAYQLHVSIVIANIRKITFFFNYPTYEENSESEEFSEELVSMQNDLSGTNLYWTKKLASSFRISKWTEQEKCSLELPRTIKLYNFSPAMRATFLNLLKKRHTDKKKTKKWFQIVILALYFSFFHLYTIYGIFLRDNSNIVRRSV